MGLCVCVFTLFFKEKERKGMELGRWRGVEDLGRVEKEKSLLRIYCINFLLQLKIVSK